VVAGDVSPEDELLELPHAARAIAPTESNAVNLTLLWVFFTRDLLVKVVPREGERRRRIRNRGNHFSHPEMGPQEPPGGPAFGLWWHPSV